MSEDVEMNHLLLDAIERSFRPSADGGGVERLLTSRDIMRIFQHSCSVELDDVYVVLRALGYEGRIIDDTYYWTVYVMNSDSD